MKMTADANTEIETCGSFRPAALQSRSCELCGHSWVLHALQRLAPRCVSGRGPVEVAVPGLVLDISSLVLFGAQAVPITLKILLDRLFSVLTPEQVGHILHTLGWCLGDYVRGYKLQDSRGRTLDHWLMASPLEERLILKQFLRFGETRPIVELMSLHSGDSSVKSLSSFQTTLHKDCAPDPTTLKPNVKPDPDKFIRPETKQDHSFPPPSPVCPFSFSSSTRSTPNSTPPLSSTFFCPPLAPSGSVLSMSHSGASFLSRKGRVSCGVCGKSFYDKGTLKIHYNAVHLKIKHRCTVSGCTMVFSSLRSRNRHSANPNPRLHTCSGNHDRDDGLFRKNQPNATDKTEDNKLWVREEQGKNQTPRREMSDATQVQFARDQSKDQRFNSIALLCTDRFDCANSCSIADIHLAKRKELNDPSQLQREVVPKKKSRKSSMPLKIERQTFEL